jgi:hypothetical protein
MPTDEMKFMTSLPAAGHQLLCVWEGRIIDRTPIIGFVVYSRDTYDHCVFPVTCEAVIDDSYRACAILRPDGKVFVAKDDATVDSLERFEEDIRKQYEAEKVTNKKKDRA